MGRTTTLVVLALVAVAVLAFGAAVAAEADDAAPDAVGAPAPATPVLSARRVPGLVAAPVADRRLREALDPLVAQARGATCVTVSTSARTVYAAQPDLGLVPASIEKLMTATVALEVLGPDHRFRTSIVAAAPPVDGVVQGDLWLVGGGDPLLATDAYLARFRRQPQVATDAEALADALVGAGVRSVTGSLLGDETRFDAERYVDAWAQRLIDQDQSGPISALTVDDNWATYPPSPDASAPDEAPAPDPPSHAAAVIGGLLAPRGVAIAGPPGAGAAPSGAVELAAVESPTVAEIVGQMLRESDNQTAEVLLKATAVAAGRPGTTADGIAVADQVLAELGLPTEGLLLTDGSGLSESNRQSCTLVQALLDRSGPDGVIGIGLAIAGTDGTLDRRFLDTPLAGRLQGKTGTLNTVTSLAGYLDSDQGAAVAFSIMTNLEPGGLVGPADLALQEQIALTLLRYPEGPPLDELGPRPPAAAIPTPDVDLPGTSTTVAG